MDKKSNIVSFDYWRKEKTRQKERQMSFVSSAQAPSYYTATEKRIAELEAEVERLTVLVVDAVNLAESNREYLMKLLRLLKDQT